MRRGSFSLFRICRFGGFWSLLHLCFFCYCHGFTSGVFVYRVYTKCILHISSYWNDDYSLYFGMGFWLMCLEFKGTGDNLILQMLTYLVLRFYIFIIKYWACPEEKHVWQTLYLWYIGLILTARGHYVSWLAIPPLWMLNLLTRNLSKRSLKHSCIINPTTAIQFLKLNRFGM